jgi:hypothetical protein
MKFHRFTEMAVIGEGAAEIDPHEIMQFQILLDTSLALVPFV